ncbi:MAG: hypothetical protein AAF682_03270 [Planctomycetota bacterium]
MARQQQSKSPPPQGLFRDILLDPERERIPEAAPVVSLGEEDDPAFLSEIRRRQRARIELRRRGEPHGTLAALHPAGLLPPRPRRKRREVIRSQRWRAAQPVLLPGVAEPPRGLGRRVEALHRRLSDPAGLAPWLAERGLGPAADPAELFDPERDLDRRLLEGVGGGPAGLWAKTGRLSTHPGDRSLRLRISFGVEGDDDASHDEARQRASGEVGLRALPGAREALGPEVRELLERTAEARLLPSQPIAYWNAPNGGARFHHDAFAEDAGGQRGVLFWQGHGRTLWLALSVEELGLRVREFLSWLDEGEMPWLREELAPGAADWARLTDVASSRAVLLHELAQPGCGLLGPLVDRGPEFTTYLADAGHAVLLSPGDVLLLPNHGLDRTAMHSVFHAGGEIAYGLSFGLREELR